MSHPSCTDYEAPDTCPHPSCTDYEAPVQHILAIGMLGGGILSRSGTSTSTTEVVQVANCVLLQWNTRTTRLGGMGGNTVRGREREGEGR